MKVNISYFSFSIIYLLIPLFFTILVFFSFEKQGISFNIIVNTFLSDKGTFLLINLAQYLHYFYFPFTLYNLIGIFFAKKLGESKRYLFIYHLIFTLLMFWLFSYATEKTITETLTSLWIYPLIQFLLSYLFRYLNYHKYSPQGQEGI